MVAGLAFDLDEAKGHYRGLVRFTLFSGTLQGHEWQECRVLPTQEAHRLGLIRLTWLQVWLMTSMRRRGIIEAWCASRCSAAPFKVTSGRNVGCRRRRRRTVWA
nr:hypothetical protein [Methylomarinum sp. Ch1-1]MDP4520888.1 hypothetical protein [Methylomarinum sp. Ch1-1]